MLRRRRSMRSTPIRASQTPHGHRLQRRGLPDRQFFQRELERAGAAEPGGVAELQIELLRGFARRAGQRADAAVAERRFARDPDRSADYVCLGRLPDAPDPRRVRQRAGRSRRHSRQLLERPRRRSPIRSETARRISPSARVETTSNGSADFRIAKSIDARDSRQVRQVCYGQDSCGTVTVTSPPQISSTTTKNIHYLILDQPDFVQCDLVSAHPGDLEIMLRGPGDPQTAPQFDITTLPAPYNNPVRTPAAARTSRASTSTPARRARSTRARRRAGSSTFRSTQRAAAFRRPARHLRHHLHVRQRDDGALVSDHGHGEPVTQRWPSTDPCRLAGHRDARRPAARVSLGPTARARSPDEARSRQRSLPPPAAAPRAAGLIQPPARRRGA